MSEQVTVHFNSGSKAVATIDSNDIEMENERLALVSPGNSVNCAEELVESALTHPARPRWAWVGDVFFFTQAVAGFELIGDQG